ncbi:hypothetical protein FB565_002602 [Actinoplanes lutulentus]|uniref:CHAT domain-containing protein n=1 Tax=Actinoplanes lutulentus TaxID=1287878 RepID=UPI000DBA626C|nr:CHAT domain-containing protein [Actinoplanes lutulentus]MBB2942889.1 hypothetical protein [Actinoplanes lutulentus]
MDLIEVADRWCAEAVRAGDAGQAADAYWHRIVVAPPESARRVPLEHRVVPLIGQRTVAQAGYRQLLAERLEEAVRVLEFGRGVLLRRTVGAVPAGQRDALRKRGQSVLLAAYQQAVDELAVLIRAQYGAPRPAAASTVMIGQNRYAIRGDDPLVAAQTRVDRLEERIAQELGIQDGPPAYSDIVRPGESIPLVYVAAAAEGYALIARDGRPPECVDLPLLTESAAESHARNLGARRIGGDLHKPVRQAVAWLTMALDPLRSRLTADPALTLVPVGWLALLPLHAAVSQHVRYAVSAHAMSPATHPVRPSDTVLLASAEHPWQAAGEPELPRFRLVAAQARMLSDLYGARLRHMPDVPAENALAEMGSTEICHFMCHGVADPAHGLNSRLQLADRPLSLAEIFAREPLRQRLVILGACESSVSDHKLLDETVSFPGALVQAGAGGVVAALWRVSEPAAALVLLRFHQGLASGRAPMEALTQAQQWLRAVTAGELKREYAVLWRDRFVPGDSVPFAEPVHWAAFTYHGV